jgi:hypothetical protein
MMIGPTPNILAAFFSLFLLSACGNGSSESYDGQMRGPWVYSTNAPGDYTLQMGNLTTTVPKRMLDMCMPYSRRSTIPEFKVSELPDTIRCEQIHIGINHVDGKPWHRHPMFSRKYLEEISTQKNHPLIFGKLANVRLDSLKRLFAIHATIRVGKDQTANSEQFLLTGMKNSPAAYITLPSYDGYRVVKNQPSSWTDFFDLGASDGIRHIRCFTPSNPTFYCTYYLTLSEDLQAELTFIDFRLHGGREFMRQRVDAFKKHICPMLKCK